MSSLSQDKFGDASFSNKNKLLRVLWWVAYTFFFRISPTPLFSFRTTLLRIFGAKIGLGCRIYPSVRIWLPANLELGNKVAVGESSIIYNQGKITIGDFTIISQGAHICASTHDYNDPIHPLKLKPIVIGENVWICADAFVGPACKINDGAVLGSRSVAFRELDEWGVYAGNPAKKIKERERF